MDRLLGRSRTYGRRRWARNSRLPHPGRWDGAVDGQQTDDAAGRVGFVTNPAPTVTYAYDGAAERRGLSTRASIVGVGDFSATYDAAGTIVSQAMPGGVAQRLWYDQAGELTDLAYTGTDPAGTPVELLAWTKTKSGWSAALPDHFEAG